MPTPSEGPHAGQLLLLKGITGSFRPRVLTALMGASGAGKTTLMVGGRWGQGRALQNRVDRGVLLLPCNAQRRGPCQAGARGTELGALQALAPAYAPPRHSLQDVLAGRKTGGKITGDVYINGFPQQLATFNRVTG